ncbi:MAG: hypothetical protein ABJB74_13525 [Gemmatimonas sp.]
MAILSPPPQKKGLSISIYLEERQQSGVASSLTARARIPLLAETK